MNREFRVGRRRVLAGTAALAVGPLAGCSGGSGSDATGATDGCTIEQAVGGGQPVPVEFDGRLEDATVELDVRWNARTTREVDVPDSGLAFPADEGEQYLVLAVAVTNPTDREVPLSRSNFEVVVETADTTREEGPTTLAAGGLEQLEPLTLKSGGTVTSQVYFAVPTAATSLTVVADDVFSDDEPVPAFVPTCDRSLAFAGDESGAEADGSTADAADGASGTPTRTPSPRSTPTATPTEGYRARAEERMAPNGIASADYRLVVTEHHVVDDGSDLTATVGGTVENVSDEAFDYVGITVGFYDRSGAKLGDGIDNTSGLSAGGRWRFEATYFGDIADVDTYRFLELDGY